MRRHISILVCALIGLLFPSSLAAADTLAGAPDCPILPPDNPWNQRVDHLPVARDSSTLIRSIGLDAPIHPGFGSGRLDGALDGIPYTIVSNRTPRVRIGLSPTYARVSFHGLYPIARDTLVQGGSTSGSGDRHALIINRDTCMDYELYGAQRHRNGRWTAAAGVVFNLRSDALRPRGWTSANGAGVPMLPGLVRYDEVKHGVIDHALWFTARVTRMAYVYPARHYDSTSDDPALPPMGIRVRLKSSVRIGNLPRQARIIAVAMKRYGMILTDDGLPWYVAGAPSPQWHNEAVLALSRLTGRDFQVVNTSSLPHPGL